MATLNNFGVPKKGSGERAQMKAPKRQDHFRVSFVGMEGNSDSITFETNTCSLPSVSYESHEVHAYNSKMHYKGKPTWEDIQVSVRDTIDNSPLRSILAQFKKEFNHETQESRAAASSYKFVTVIEQLDGTDATATESILSKWVCEGCFFLSINFGENGLDYSTSNFTTISMTIKPDNCTPYNGDGSLMAVDPEISATDVLENPFMGKNMDV